MIRNATLEDAAAIAEIYNHYIAETIVTFEEELVSADEISTRITESNGQEMPYFAALNDDDKLIGYAYASKWKGRCAYRYSVEVTIYLHHQTGQNGWGSQLYNALFNALREKGMHSVIGGISLPNPASIALHEKFGMKKVAHFKEVGYKFDKWVDVGYWQGTLTD